MPNLSDQQRQIITRGVMRQPQAIVEDTIKLWENLAREISPIIGEVGFESLYHRSIHLSSAEFPWLASAGKLPPNDSSFAGLRAALQAEDCEKAGEASIALLGIFVEIVIRLIGEPLTANILRAAWSDEIFQPAVKELKA
ncbi:hypothetical protein [Lacisediminimonas sp.]|uniref:hypothetical protein n=1 Tax=Lacisediminimonas sp. TaxID=3060582 RepID=UPI00271C2942|nr:hypothetical protein [Lacisediminimonas sp.]MDO8298784.1 hypothetical protein [Lacisediminimonas sp.]MDO9218232.1 hypothetical protein [Lacisediminimonas sp.]